MFSPDPVSADPDFADPDFVPDNLREVTPVVSSTYQLRSRSHRTRAEGEGEPNERTPLLKKVSLTNLSSLFMILWYVQNTVTVFTKHILLVLSPLLVTCQLSVTEGHSSRSCLS